MVNNLPANGGDAGDVGSIPGFGRSLGRGSSIPLQYSCLGNHMDRGAWQVTVHRVAQSRTKLKHTVMHTGKHTFTTTVIIHHPLQSIPLMRYKLNVS